MSTTAPPQAAGRPTPPDADELRRLRVLHLDHTVERGGAELALARLCLVAPWQPRLALPRADAAEQSDSPGGDLGVFAEAAAARPGTVTRVGPAQGPGASRAGALSLAGFGARLIAQALALRASQAFRNSQVVHANTTRSASYAALACRGTRKPLVVHLRDLVDRDSLGGFGHAAMTRFVLPRADAVVANSRATLASAQPYLGEHCRQAVVPSGVGDGYARPAGSPIVRPRVRRVALVARLDPWKGQELLMRAFADAFGGSDVVLEFMGAPAFGHEAHLDALQALASRLDLDGRVEFAGHRDDVRQRLDDVDICVQASLRPEPMGQNVLQYLAAGRPTIACDEGGPAEWITDGVNGLLVPARDQAALAAALRRLAADEQLRHRLADAALDTPGLPVDPAASALALGEVLLDVATRAGRA